MLYRNTPRVNELWKKSAVARRVLSSPRYLVFDEWWGALRAEDNLPRVLGREAEAGHIRLSRSSVRRKWLTDDKRHAGGQRLAETD
jgi:hypothetical protein